MTNYCQTSLKKAELENFFKHFVRQRRIYANLKKKQNVKKTLKNRMDSMKKTVGVYIIIIYIRITLEMLQF